MNAYTVCFLFDIEDTSRVLLIRKDRTCYAGKFNGIGGKVEAGEDVYEGAVREIQEETGATPYGLVLLDSITTSDRTGKSDAGPTCRLHYLYGFVFPRDVSQQTGETELLAWIPSATIFSNPEWFAGEDGTFQQMFQLALDAAGEATL